MQMRIPFTDAPGRCLFVLFALVMAAECRAGYPLADKVPGDAVLYIGWAGAGSQSAAYAASDMSAFVSHSNLPALAQQYLPQVWERLAGGPIDNKDIVHLQKIFPKLWQYPTAIYVAHLSIKSNGEPDGDDGLICDAGDDADQLAADLLNVLKGIRGVKGESAGFPGPGRSD